ncbi:hypothetical protein SteCoe_21573 [Stentor coeruleus]|uniref:Cation/H+ exchanger domain-containing protein n=1 Tax=Stentor coeruleus TaxID=5963 RepID=A0A1R2BP64_9CILI|nr:hypothetical protein SteCoe_21573 [Stentor coeruleus]
MGLNLEITIISLCIFSILLLGGILRNLGSRLVQEKFLALIIGIAAGGVLNLCNITNIINNTSNYIPIMIVPYLLEKTYNMPKALLYNRLGSILLISVLGGLISVLISSFSIFLLFKFFDPSISLSTAAKLSIILIIPGGQLGIEKDNSSSLHLYLSISSICTMYPLFDATTLGFASLIKEWTIGFIIGITIGIIGSLIFKVSCYSKMWNTLEIISCLLISIIAHQISLEIGGSSVLALMICSLILSKYVFITDMSLVVRSSLLNSLSGVCEIIGQLWLGASIWERNLIPSYLSIFPIIIGFSYLSYLFCMGLGYICKLKTIKFQDCLCSVIAGFRSLPTICLICMIPKDLQEVCIVSCIILDIFGIFASWYINDGKEELNYLISSNPCSKLKVLLQGLEENYILPIFVRENLEVSILSPKFNEGSQRFEAGIQIRQESRDEASRELQALNLNITETELQGALHLK